MKGQKLEIKTAELPRCANDFLDFTFCFLIFAFSSGAYR
jgi:hypothetical protein